MARKNKSLSIERILENELNLAPLLDATVLGAIGSQVVDDYKKDKDSRSEWEERSKDVMKLALQVTEEKSYPWPGSANVKYPLLTLSAIQFASRVDLFQGSDIVRIATVGWDDTGLKADRAMRIQKHMSWQLTHEMDEWEDDNDRMMHALPIIGAMFKKTYFCPVKQQNVSELVYPDVLVFDYWAKNVEKAARKTQLLSLTPNDVKERVRAGIYRDVDLGESADPYERPLSGEHEGVDPYDDQDAPYRILEQHRNWDLDGDGYKEPYCITVHEETREVLRITPRFDKDSISYNDKDEIVRIEPVEYFTQYTFIPDPSGGNLGIGFGHLQGPLNEVCNTLINQLIDAGTLNNLQSGFIGKGLRIKAGDWALSPGEWKMVQSTGEDLAKNIIPLPTKEPSQVLFLLLQLITQAAERVGSITDAIVGDQPAPNTPATSTLATIEQGLKVFKKIHKRLYSAFSKEFSKLYRLNRKYLEAQEYFQVLDVPKFQIQRLHAITQGLYDMNGMMMVVAQDYRDDLDVYPSADPNVMTEMERMKKLEVLLQTMPLGWNPEELKIRFLEALNVQNPDALLQPPPPPPPDPKIMVEQAKLQLEGAKFQGEMQVKQAEMQMAQQKMVMEVEGKKADIEKTRMEVVKIEAEIRKILAEVQADPAEEKAIEAQFKMVELQAEHQIKQRELELKQAELALKAQEVQLGAEGAEKDRDIKKKEIGAKFLMGGKEKEGEDADGYVATLTKAMKDMTGKLDAMEKRQSAPKKITRDANGLITQIGEATVKRDGKGAATEVVPS